MARTSKAAFCAIRRCSNAPWGSYTLCARHRAEECLRWAEDIRQLRVLARQDFKAEDASLRAYERKWRAKARKAMKAVGKGNER